MARSTTTGTPFRALADAIHGCDPEASTVADADRIARAVHEHLTSHGWELDVKAPADALRCILLPESDPGAASSSPGDAFAHAVHCSTEGAARFGTGIWGTLAVDHLASLGWHLLYADPDSGDQATVLPVGFDAVDVGPDGRAIGLRSDQDAVVFSNNFDAEIDILAALVKTIDQEFLEPAERSRIVAFLADRYIPGAVETEV